MTQKYNNEIYKMYEKEVEKNKRLSQKYEKLRFEVEELRYENKQLKTKLDNMDSIIENAVNKAVEKATKPLIEKINILETELNSANKEISRLKNELHEKDKIIDNLNNIIDSQGYNIDKLEGRINKNSTNSSIPTSKEIIPRANTYNHREKTSNKKGAKFGHKGSNLSKEKIEEKIKAENLKVTEIKHYVRGNKKNDIKYRLGIKSEVYVEKHIFIYSDKYTEKLPEEFYTDVTYTKEICALVVMLGNYFSIPYNKIKELIKYLSNQIIDISEGTINNIYKQFSKKTEPTLDNITKNILNGSYQHTDETCTKENGKETYYRGYANPTNVIYKYHHHKGDTPIEEDGILTNFYGTIISDHDTGIFKYGTNNQDCIIHIGRYCRQEWENTFAEGWANKMYHFLLKLESQRKILSKFGRTEFTKEEISLIEKEYDEILGFGKIENELISSTYWKDEANKLLRRLIKYKTSVLFYIHDFTVPYDNNFMERALRMIKGKTKVSGGFRSSNGPVFFGNTMSIIKTSILRNLNPLKSIMDIIDGKVLFA